MRIEAARQVSRMHQIAVNDDFLGGERMLQNLLRI